MTYLMRAFGVTFTVCGGFGLSLLIFDPEAISKQSTILDVAMLAAAMGPWTFAPGKCRS